MPRHDSTARGRRANLRRVLRPRALLLPDRTGESSASGGVSRRAHSLDPLSQLLNQAPRADYPVLLFYVRSAGKEQVGFLLVEHN
jgi:hypothetical protein